MVIHSDSAAAICVSDCHKVHSRVVDHAITRLNEATQIVSTNQLKWIKAHVGYIGNVLADEQARLGGERDTVNVVVPIPQSYHIFC